MRQRSTEKDPYALACEVGAAITASLALDDALQTVARLVATALDVWEVDLHEYYSESDTLVASAIWSRELTPEDEAWVGSFATLSERPAYREAITGRQIVESHIEDETDPVEVRLMETWGEVAAMTVPLVFRDVVVGCLTMVEKRLPGRFDDEDRRLATLLAVPAAAAVHDARMFRRQSQQTRYLASLLDTSRALVSTLALDEVLALVSSEARRALASDRCLIHEYDAAADALVERATSLLAERPGDDDDRADVSRALRYGPSELDLVASDAPVVTNAADPIVPLAVRSAMEVSGERTRLTVPLVYGTERLGLLTLVETERERRYTEAEIELACGLGEQAAVAVARARLFQREEAQRERLLALLETGRMLSAALDPAEVLEGMSAEVATHLGVMESDVAVALRAPDGRFVPPAEAVSVWEEAVGEGAAGSTLPDGLDALTTSALSSLVPAQDLGDDATTLVVPLAVGDAAAGYISLRRLGATAFGDEEIELVQVVANQAAAALENARLYRVVERQAITDGLTGLYNHRYFYERLHEEFARSQRYGLPLSLLIIDVDDFKRFNDRYGHPVGDRVLAEVGRVLRDQIRQGIDFPARYGGEEFAVLLPNTARDGAQAVGARLARELGVLTARIDGTSPPAGEPACEVGERIRVSIAGTGLEDVPGAEGAHVTVSIGVASSPGQAGSPDELVRNADKALYLAKRSGKNRVETFGA